jgi:vitamin B12 transporter
MFIKPTKVALACAGIFATISSVQAQNSSEFNPVVVTAQRQEQRELELVSNNLTVISAEEIAKSGASTIGEILNQQVGVQFDRAGGPGSAESIFIRGGNSSHTLLLVDGVRVNSATTGAGSFESIPLAIVERIEILRGGASSLYGADALSGVVQVFTKSNAGNYSNVDISFGNLDSRNISLSLGRRINDLNISFGVSEKASKGINLYSRNADAYNSDLDGYLLRSFNFKVDHKIQNGRVGFSHISSELTSQFDSYASDSSYNQYLAEADWKNKHEIKVSSIWHEYLISSNWLSKITISDGVDSVITTPSSIYLQPYDLFKTKNQQINWQNNFSTEYGKFIVGLEYLDQKLETTGSYEKKNRTIGSQYVGLVKDFNKNQIQLNVRRDDNDQFGEKLTNSVGYSYRPNQSLKFYASRSTAFKAPSFNDLYFPVTPGVGGGNPNVMPETSKNHEFGVQYAKLDRSISLTRFVSEISNLISWAESPVGSYEYYPSNVGEAKISGYEFRASKSFSNLGVGLNYTNQSPKDLSTGLQLVRRSEQHGLAFLSYKLNSFTLRTELAFQGQKFDDAANTRKISGYGLVNTYAEKKIDKEMTIYARINNLFDKDYVASITSSSLSPGMPMTFFIGFRYSAN